LDYKILIFSTTSLSAGNYSTSVSVSTVSQRADLFLVNVEIYDPYDMRENQD
jgi:hypothetical protein